MAYSNDWSDAVPIDHTKFKAAPGAMRRIRIDVEQRLQNLFYGWIPGETQTDEGVKNLPFVKQASDPGATANKIKVYSKTVASIAELFTQDEAGNVIQLTTGGKINSLALSFTLANLTNILQVVYPVGCIYTTVVATNPNTVFGFGTWVDFGTGRVPVGLDAGDPDFDTVEETGGEKTHTLIASEMPSHTHTIRHYEGYASGQDVLGGRTNTSPGPYDNVDTLSAGGDGAHNNLQPYIVVYMWKRTA